MEDTLQNNQDGGGDGASNAQNSCQESGEKRKREISEEQVIPFYQQNVVKSRRLAGYAWFSYQKNDARDYHCSICMQTFSPKFIQISRLKCHESTKRHTRAKANQDIALMFTSQGSKTAFHEDFIALVLANNVPPNRIDDLYPSSFISALLARGETSLLTSSSYRLNYAEPSYERWLGTIVAEVVGNSPFSLLTDESSKNNRRVLNTIAMTASGKSVLIDTMVCGGQDTVSGEYIRDYIVSLMNRFAFEPSSLVGLTRDNASYMQKAVKLLNENQAYRHVLSVGCLSHGLNLVVKDFLEPHCNVKDKLFSALKTLFSKPSKRRDRAASLLPGFINAVQVSQTRWGGWLDSISFVYEKSAIIMVDYCAICHCQ